MSDERKPLELKSKHLWQLVEEFAAPRPESEHTDDEDEAANDMNTPDWVAHAMLDDLKAMEAALAEKDERIRQLEAQGQWEDAEYNDIINVDNGTQVRVVIDQSGRKVDPPVHLHIRERVEGEWRHVSITTLADNYRLQRRTVGEGE